MQQKYLNKLHIILSREFTYMILFYDKKAPIDFIFFDEKKLQLVTK